MRRWAMLAGVYFLFLGPMTTIGDEGDRAERIIRVFVALCDNQHQGIQPVPARIGDGDDPEANLYWGCSDAIAAYFPKSRFWDVVSREKDLSEVLLRRLTLRHRDASLVLIAEAYRGSAMRECLREFENELAKGSADLVVFIGHNGLMDFDLPLPEVSPEDRARATAKGRHAPDAVVLACRSEPYFVPRLATLGAEPLLLTRQLMYPGAFVLHDVIEVWRRGGSDEAALEAAGRAYSRNQKISVRAARGVFWVPDP